MESTPVTAGYSKTESWKIFDAISRRYDLNNRILSLGLDRGWRKNILALLPAGKNLKTLDLATGTADVAITLAQHSLAIRQIYGIDLSEKMLEVGRQKVQALNLSERVQLQKGDAMQLNFLDQEFDFATMAFGIRNVPNPIMVLKEIYRTLKPGGRTVILEFSLPKNIFIRAAHLLYLKIIVPLIGGLVSRNFRAYYYLNKTIEEFPYGEMFCRMMRQCGFKKVSGQPLFFGVATIYQGDKE